MLPTRDLPVLALLSMLVLSSPALAAGVPVAAPDSARASSPPEEATRHYLQGRWLEEAGDAERTWL